MSYALVELAATVAISSLNQTKQVMKDILENKTLHEEKIRGVLRHLTIYSGFPSSMNSFALLKGVINEITP